MTGWYLSKSYKIGVLFCLDYLVIFKSIICFNVTTKSKQYCPIFNEKGNYGMLRLVTVDSGTALMKSFSNFSLVSGDVRDDGVAINWVLIHIYRKLIHCSRE